MRGIAIQTLLLMVIGILVISIIAFLIYKAAQTKSLSVYECKSKLIDICRICSNTNWDETYGLTPLPYKTVINPCSDYSEFYYWKDNKCCGDNVACGWMKKDCDRLIGLVS